MVQKHPWDLAKAHKYLNDLCDANSANTVPTPPEVSFVFTYTMKPHGSNDPLLPGLVFDNSGVGEPRVVELQVRKTMKRPAAAAMKRPAAAPLKRPAAAKVQKKPAAAAALAGEPPQDDEEDDEEVGEDEDPEEDSPQGDNGDEDGPPEDEDMFDDEQGDNEDEDGPPEDEDAPPAVLAPPPGPPAPGADPNHRRTGCSKCRWHHKGCGVCRDWALRGHKGYYYGPDGETVMRGPA